MLKRREKHRYVSVVHHGPAIRAFSALERRLVELFGSVAFQKTSLRLLNSEEGVMILRFNLDATENVLAAIALTEPAMMTLDMSSTVKRLRRRLLAKVNTVKGENQVRG